MNRFILLSNTRWKKKKKKKKDSKLYQTLLHYLLRHDNKGLGVSYNISLFITKGMKLHRIREIMAAAKELVNTMIHKFLSHINSQIPFNNWVQTRIDKIAEDVGKQLFYNLSAWIFSIQFDKSTLSNAKTLLLSYVQLKK